jgi:hypothetical protein
VNGGRQQRWVTRWARPGARLTATLMHELHRAAGGAAS